MSETPKPCPLCGGGWYWFSNWSAPAGKQVHARCNGDDCGCAVYGESQQQVIDRINRRAPGPATSKMLAKIAWFLGRFAGADDLEVPIKREMAAAAVAEHEPARPAVASEPLPPGILEYLDGQT